MWIKNVDIFLEKSGIMQRRLRVDYIINLREGLYMKFKAYFSLFIVTLILFMSCIKVDAAPGAAADTQD